VGERGSAPPDRSALSYQALDRGEQRLQIKRLGEVGLGLDAGRQFLRAALAGDKQDGRTHLLPMDVGCHTLGILTAQTRIEHDQGRMDLFYRRDRLGGRMSGVGEIAFDPECVRYDLTDSGVVIHDQDRSGCWTFDRVPPEPSQKERCATAECFKLVVEARAWSHEAGPVGSPGPHLSGLVGQFFQGTDFGFPFKLGPVNPVKLHELRGEGYRFLI
jgi:hypothetical protein